MARWQAYDPHVPTSDAQLLVAWGKGDPRAGSRLFNRYFLAVSRFFANKIPEDHDDLIQETFMACLRGRERLRDKSSFRAYLFGAASNVLRMYFRRQRLRQPTESLDEISAHDLAPGPSTVLREDEQDQVLLDALRQLPLALQVVMELYYWEGLRTQEIAEVVDLPTGTVRSHLRRGRQLLQAALGGEASDPRSSPYGGRGLDEWATALRDTITRRCA